jgi:hypothetical protein
MLFVRIVEAGVNRNGNSRRKVYIYEPVQWQPKQYDYISIDDMKKLDFGRVYKEQHYIMTQQQKQHILDKLTSVYGDNYTYIFE